MNDNITFHVDGTITINDIQINDGEYEQLLNEKMIDNQDNTRSEAHDKDIQKESGSK